MRLVTTHHDPALTVEALDAPGADGACPAYLLTVHQQCGLTHSYCGTWELRFAHDDRPGLTNGALLAVVRDRLEGRQRGPSASADGDTALTCVTWAMEALVAEAGEKEHGA